MQKNLLRKQVKQKIDNLSFYKRKSYDYQISIQLENLLENKTSLIAYYPLYYEVNLLPLLLKFKKTKKIFLPKIENDKLVMREWNENLYKGAFGILEPSGKKFQIHEGEKLSILVPALAFDVDAYRLGYGKGFYDRFLEKNVYLQKIGVIYSDCIIKEDFREAHDQKMDLLICEKETIFI